MVFDSAYDHARSYITDGHAPFEGPCEFRLKVRNERKVDLDNLLIGYKGFLDGLVRGGMLPDDGPDIVGFISIEWEGVGEPRTIIELEEM